LNTSNLTQNPPAKTSRKRSPWLKFTLLGILGLLIIAAISGYSGYSAGISDRQRAESTQKADGLALQFALGEQDMANKAFGRALQRFEYIARIDPSYPGLIERLAQVQLAMNSTATPTVAPTPTISPTPDTRSVDVRTEEMFSAALQFMANKDWNSAIQTLLDLRKADPNYHAVDVDGQLFLAFRNRGREKITQTDLEGGLYDLALAEQFGPLDSEAQGLLYWTRLYITGASFWELNWEQAVFYFSQVAPQMPSLMDGSNMTAKERYRQALIGYGNMLGAAGEWCSAQEQYLLSMEVGADPQGIADAALEEATKNCEGLSDEGRRNRDNDEGEENPPAEEPVATEPPLEATPYPQPQDPTQEPAPEPTATTGP
jgi:hypothetical protein